MARPRIRTAPRQPHVANSTNAVRNELLAALPHSTSQRLIACCTPVELAFGDLLCEQGDCIRHVYFPIGAFVSLIATVDSRHSLEMGIVGTEGMLGVSLAQGVKVAPLRALVQGPGFALRMGASQFVGELKRSLPLQRQLNLYLYVLMHQLAQMAACTRFHLVEARLARWLLMTRDHSRADEFFLTHAFIAYMLGVRRVGISLAASELQDRKLIRYVRGKITILNARGLEAAACPCYASANDSYDRVMTAPIRNRSTMRVIGADSTPAS
jgi:CRP-like cAMP-binding protein